MMGKIKTGETELTIGTIADGQYLKRVGTEIQSAAASGGGGVETDTQANRPAAGSEGTLFVPTDGLPVSIDNGSSWDSYDINSFKCSAPPAASSLTQVNFAAGGGTTLTDDGNTRILAQMGSNATGSNQALALTAVPAAPYSFVVGMDVIYVHPDKYSSPGIVLTDGTSNPKSMYFYFCQYPNTSYFTLVIGTFSNLTTWNSTKTLDQTAPVYVAPFGRYYFKIQDNNTNRIFSYGFDGRNWVSVYTCSRTEYFTPTHIGLIADQSNTAVATTKLRSKIKVFHWSLG